MEVIAIVQRQTTEAPPPDVVDIKNQINTLLQRVRVLNNALPACQFTTTATARLVNVEVDKELLKNGEPEDYVGRGYELVVNGNTKAYKPRYFKRSEVLKLYTKE